MVGRGILAIWNDCKVGEEDAYEAWYQGEHLIERLSIPGFLRGRRYESLDRSASRFFTYYETVTPGVLFSETYRHRIDHPTPLTHRIMSDVFTGMNRTVCHVVESCGQIRGSHALTVKLNEHPVLDDTFAKWKSDPSIARAELWSAVDDADIPKSEEERIRGGDDKIDVCLFVEMLRRATAEQVAIDLSKRLGRSVQAMGLYSLLCDLTSEDSR